MNNQNEKSRKQSHLQLHQKTRKYLGINLTKEVKDPCTGNYKSLMKGTQINGMIFHVYWLEELVLLKIPI